MLPEDIAKEALREIAELRLDFRRAQAQRMAVENMLSASFAHLEKGLEAVKARVAFMEEHLAFRSEVK
jgi:hypothetical protein